MENMSLEALTLAFAELKRRVDIAETKLSQQAGQFEFITGQLRDIQLYMHARFDDFDKQFSAVRAEMQSQIGQVRSEMKAQFAEVHVRLDQMDAKIDALPRVLAELLAKR